MKIKTSDFINDCEAFTENLLAGKQGHGYWRLRSDFEDFRKDNGDNWLALPVDFCENFIGAPYAWGETVPEANYRVLCETKEYGVDLIRVEVYNIPGMTTCGGYLAFDATHEDTIQWVVDTASALDSYPVLDDEALYEVEDEKRSEAVDDWLALDVQETICEALNADYPRDVEPLDEHTTKRVKQIAYELCMDYSADDISFDEKRAQEFAQEFELVYLVKGPSQELVRVLENLKTEVQYRDGSISLEDLNNLLEISKEIDGVPFLRIKE